MLAKTRGVALVALNLPGEIVRRVGRGGLESLDDVTRRSIPTVALDSSAHRRVFEAMIASAAHHPRSKKKAPHHGAMRERLGRLYEAQSLWDEAMAEAIAATLEARAKTHVVVLAGSGHIIYDLGISMRLRRRMPEVKQLIVAPVAVEGKGPRRVARQLADFVVGVESDNN